MIHAHLRFVAALTIGALFLAPAATRALTQPEKLISVKIEELYPGHTIFTASPDEVADATIQAIQDADLRRATKSFSSLTPDKLAAVGIERAPALAGPVAAAALYDLTTEAGNALPQRKAKASASKLAKNAVLAARGNRRVKPGEGIAGTQDDIAGTASVTAWMVGAVRDSDDSFLLHTVVTAALKALESDRRNGVGDGEVESSLGAEKDFQMAEMIKAASAAARAGRILEVAHVVGFAFAKAHLDTGGTDDEETFREKSVASIVLLLKAGSRRVPNKVGTRLAAEVADGIHAAFAAKEEEQGAAANSEVSGLFRDTHGMPGPVTDVLGL